MTEQYTVREISFKLHGKEPAITATESSVIKTLEYLKNLINQPTEYPKLKAYRNDSSNKEWYEEQRKARLGEYMSKVRKAETHINFENSEFLGHELFVVKENESETYINRNDFIDLLKTDDYLKELYSLNPFWEVTAKTEIKESAEIVVENKEGNNKEYIPSEDDIIKLKDRLRKHQFFKERKVLHKWINYRIDKALERSAITCIKGKPPTFKLKLSNGLMGEIYEKELEMVLSVEAEDNPQNSVWEGHENPLEYSAQANDLILPQLKEATEKGYMYQINEDDVPVELIIRR